MGVFLLVKNVLVDDFYSWGWCFLFLVSVVFVVFGFWMCCLIGESVVFVEVKVMCYESWMFVIEVLC